MRSNPKRIFVAAAIAACIVTILSPAARADETRLHIVPQPKQAVFTGGAFEWKKGVCIALTVPKDATQRLAAQQIREEVRRDTGFDAPVKSAAAAERCAASVLLGIPAKNKTARAAAARYGVAGAPALSKPEGYALVIGRGGILLAGADSDGLFWAAQSLKLIVRADRSGRSIPAVRIGDWPDFRFRGVELDVSRGPMPNDADMLRTVRRLSELKINKLTLYIEDVFCFKSHPDIPPAGGCFTARQIRALVAYSKQYHIELIGGLQSFGHEEKLLSKPRYKPLAEQQGHPSVLSPANPGTYKLLADLYAEIVPLFESKLFVIGCDETGGLAEEQSRAMAEKIGMEGVYAGHIAKLEKMLAPYGKRPVMWADIALQHPRILDLLPKNAVMMPWEYHVQKSFDAWLRPLSEKGYAHIASAGITNWSRLFPEVETAYANVRQFALDGKRYGSLGVINSAYHDDGETLNGYDWFPLAFGAEASWNPATADPNVFRPDFSAAFYGDTAGRVSKAVALISEAQNIMEMEYFADKTYFAWPPAIISATPRVARNEARRCAALMDRALRNLDAARPDAVANADNIEYIAFAARRIRAVARHKIAYAEALDLYSKITPQAKPEDVVYSLGAIETSLAGIAADTRAELTEYRRLWMAENRPYFFENNEKKYRAFIAKIDAARRAAADAKSAYIASGRLPKSKEDLGL